MRRNNKYTQKEKKEQKILETMPMLTHQKVRKREVGIG